MAQQQSSIRLPMPLHDVFSPSEDRDDSQDAVSTGPTPAVTPGLAPVEEGPKMVSRSTQAGGVDQGTQVDLPCQRCAYGQYNYYHPSHYYPPPQPVAPQWYHNHHLHHGQPTQPPYASHPSQAGFRVQTVDQGRGPRLAPASGPPPPLVSLPPGPSVPPTEQPIRPPGTATSSLPPGPTTWDAMVLRRTWSTVEDAEDDIKNFAESLGFALIRRRSGNRDPESGKPTRIHYCCHLDAARITHLDRNPEDRKRKRQSAVSSTKKQDPCPWQICLRWNRQKKDRPDLYHMWHLAWTMGDDARFRTHNHPMDPDAANIPANRRRHMTQEVKDQILELTGRGMSAAEVVEAMKDKNPRLKLNKSTIDNIRRGDMLRKKKKEAGDSAAGGAGENTDGSDRDGGQNGEAGDRTPATETSQGSTPAPEAQTSAPTAVASVEATAVVLMTGLAQNPSVRPPKGVQVTQE